MLKKFLLQLSRSVARFFGRVLLFPFQLFGQLLRVIKKFWISFLQLSSWKKVIVIAAFCLLSTLLSTTTILIGNRIVINETKAKIYTEETLPNTYQTGIILGAKVYPDGGLSDMTKDRSDTAIELYQQKKVSKLLVSGDHGRKNYDEVNSIKNYLLKNGIPEKDIFLDHAGFDTYDSLYRARGIFQVDSVVIITQNFHLPRSLFLAQKLGLNAIGVRADRHQYYGIELSELREKIAVIKAWSDILFHAKPKFLGEKIPITGDNKKSWDE